MKKGLQCKKPVELLSIYPTLIELCNLPKLNDLERWRYFRYADGSEELYDHINDPNEWDNLAGITKYDNTIKDVKNIFRKRMLSNLK